MSKQATSTSAASALAVLALVTAGSSRAFDEAAAVTPPPAALAPADPTVTPYSPGDGTYRLAWDMAYLQRLTGRLELRHREYFVDDNLKSPWQRSAVFWSVKWRF